MSEVSTDFSRANADEAVAMQKTLGARPQGLPNACTHCNSVEACLFAVLRMHDGQQCRVLAIARKSAVAHIHNTSLQILMYAAGRPFLCARCLAVL